MEGLPTDVLTLLLGFAWRNTLSIALVCKKWNQIVNRPQYWARAISERFTVSSTIPLEHQLYFKHTWSPFKMFPDRKSQLSWLFDSYVYHLKGSVHRFDPAKSGWASPVWKGENSSYVMWSGKGTLLKRTYISHGKLFERRQILLGFPPGYIGYTKTVRAIGASPNEISYLEWIDTEKKIQWKGQGLVVGEDNIVPHGDGELINLP
jgi:hypothetical protein